MAGVIITTDERDMLQYAARSLDEIREHLEQALAATAPALVYVRLAWCAGATTRGRSSER